MIDTVKLRTAIAASSLAGAIGPQLRQKTTIVRLSMATSTGHALGGYSGIFARSRARSLRDVAADNIPQTAAAAPRPTKSCRAEYGALYGA